ncbi:MAG: cation diffusion facilitator family transporter [Desulfarculales bacterium]|jgi:cobalt-zinc-cadmium efflux system protein|nr:cation diffusion facilitator family transporter [Desulfarculales bacterium]
MTVNSANDIQELENFDQRSRRLLGRAFILTCAFMLLEIGGGLYSGSLALLSDAAHMLLDSLALAFNWLAIGISLRPADTTHTYGHYRVQVLASFINSLLLLLLSVWIVYESVTRLITPEPVLGLSMLLVAVTGLAVNIVVLHILKQGKQNLNHQAAWVNVWGDTLSSAATVVGGIIILGWQWYLIDPILSIVLALIIIKAAWGVFAKSWDVLMESQHGLPSLQDIYQAIKKLPQVEEVHNLHLWKLTPERPVITLHVKVAHTKDAPTILRQVQQILKNRFNLGHATIQVESEEIFHEDEEPKLFFD